MKIQDWLQLFRAQTAPATILLILTPYLTNASLLSVETVMIFIFGLFVHWISFGHNSLMDTVMGYDLEDPGKSHHPLVAGRITRTAAHNVIHWSLCGLAVFAILLSLMFSPNPLRAIIVIFLWYVFGYAYNSGLSKETFLSFIPICICFTAMGAWGWFLANDTLSTVGWLLLAYYFMTLLFQVSWSGHLKEMGLKEKSNILVRMGAKVENGRFRPGCSSLYGAVVKFVNVPVLGALLLAQDFTVLRLLWFGVVVSLIAHMLFQLIKPRIYYRPKELRNMSMMEILTIYAPIPLVLPWLEAGILMLFGVLYFWTMNRLLWGVASHPRV